MANTGGTGYGTDYSKLVAGLQGGGVGAAISTVVVWLLDARGMSVPPEVAVALSSIFTALLSGFGTWLKREGVAP